MLVAVAIVYALGDLAAPTALQLQSDSTFEMDAGLDCACCSTN
jgi:hypothetical protein